MARNEEKAQSMLNRYLRSQKDERRDEKRRPYISTLCDDVDEAGKWRLQVMHDIRRRVDEIQNPGLDEEKARELNDKINKLLRERGHWERRIVTLGGKDHGKVRRGTGGDDVGKDVFQHNGFFYFGAARDLPGVKELVERRKEPKRDSGMAAAEEEESAETLYARVDVEYFGYLDDDDAELHRHEAEMEKRLRADMVREWEQNNKAEDSEQWDDSYLQFVGKKPEISAEGLMDALLLERKKAEALEQLEGRLRANT